MTRSARWGEQPITPTSPADALAIHLRADLQNACELLDLIETRDDLGFDVPALERMIGYMRAEIEAHVQAPELRVRERLLDAK